MFDPNEDTTEKKKKAYTWGFATFSSLRRPKFKVHGHRGHFINAIQTQAYRTDFGPNSSRKGYKFAPVGEFHAYVKDNETNKWVELKMRQVIKIGELPWEE